MLESSAGEIFLVVASVCVVLVTTLVAAAIFYVIKVAIEVRSLAKLVQGEASRLIAGRKSLGRNLRFGWRWIFHFLRGVRGP